MLSSVLDILGPKLYEVHLGEGQTLAQMRLFKFGIGREQENHDLPYLCKCAELIKGTWTLRGWFRGTEDTLCFIGNSGQ